MKAAGKGSALKRPPRWAMQVTAAAAGLVTGMSEILGFPSYMSAAAASLAGREGIAVFIGLIAAAVLKGDIEGRIVQLCAVLVISAVRAVDPLGEKRDDPIYDALLNTGVLMLFGCVVTVAMPADFYMASMRMVNALLSGCTVFVVRTVLISRERSGVFDLTGMNGIFLGIVYIMTLSVLTSVNIFSVNLGRVFGVFMLLQAVRRYRSFGGAAIGALTACGVMICDPSLTRNTLLMATAGLICGAFVHFGTLSTVLCFLVASLVSLVAVGVNGDTYRMFADLVAGSLIFVAVPLQAVRRVGRSVSGFRSSLEIVGQTTSSRLSMAGETLGDIRRRLDRVSAAMDRRTAGYSAAEEVKSCICEDCPSYPLCFEAGVSCGDRLRAEEAMESLENVAQTCGTVSRTDVEVRLRCCTRPSLIAGAFTEFSRRMNEQKAENIRMRELRGMLCEQLYCMEDILKDLSFRSSQVRSIDPGLSSRVREFFIMKGCRAVRACVYVDEALCRRADVYISEEPGEDRVRLTAELSSLLDCDMGMPDVLAMEDNVRLSFAELPAYSAAVGSFTASAGEEYSGDSFEVFDAGGSEKYVMLSDGMGTGKRARLDSVFTVSLAKKLICSGLSMTTSHRLINSMLRVKGWEESFATMDLLKLDLCGGCGAFLKSGAVRSRLCRDGSVMELGGQAFPVGILPDCAPDISHVKLFAGDIIIMNSDGADEETAEEFSQLAAASPELSAQELAGLAGRAAMEMRKGKRCDDLTVLVIKIELSKEV
ncbi:MAG: SpoIIE family protein phosphatase [Ruminococcus sp.]|nr:SpoIIE family protein phosphatase [Ruminococcus sp.]